MLKHFYHLTNTQGKILVASYNITEVLPWQLKTHKNLISRFHDPWHSMSKVKTGRHTLPLYIQTMQSSQSCYMLGGGGVGSGPKTLGPVSIRLRCHKMATKQMHNSLFSFSWHNCQRALPWLSKALLTISI